MRKYVVMAIDELGDEYRPSFLESLTFEFPDFDESNKAMQSAFLAWEDECMKSVMKVVEKHHPYGWECSPFLERIDSGRFDFSDIYFGLPYGFDE